MALKYDKFRVKLISNGWTITPHRRCWSWDKNAQEFCKRVDEIPDILARLATVEEESDGDELD